MTAKCAVEGGMAGLGERKKGEKERKEEREKEEKGKKNFKSM